MISKGTKRMGPLAGPKNGGVGIGGGSGPKDRKHGGSGPGSMADCGGGASEVGDDGGAGRGHRRAVPRRGFPK